MTVLLYAPKPARVRVDERGRPVAAEGRRSRPCARSGSSRIAGGPPSRSAATTSSLRSRTGAARSCFQTGRTGSASGPTTRTGLSRRTPLPLGLLVPRRGLLARRPRGRRRRAGPRGAGDHRPRRRLGRNGVRLGLPAPGSPPDRGRRGHRGAPGARHGAWHLVPPDAPGRVGRGLAEPVPAPHRGPRPHARASPRQRNAESRNFHVYGGNSTSRRRWGAADWHDAPRCPPLVAAVVVSRTPHRRARLPLRLRSRRRAGRHLRARRRHAQRRRLGRGRGAGRAPGSRVRARRVPG